MYVLGNDIKTMRISQGMTQEEFSVVLDVSVSTLRLWERLPDSTVRGMLEEKFLSWLERQDNRVVPRKFRYLVKKRKKKMAGDVREEIKLRLGRDFEVVQTANGKFVVEYMNFNTSPPPEGDTETEAMERFLEYYGAIDSNEAEENTDAIGP